MEPITTYTSSEGETMLIAEMNQYHLVNALLKTAGMLAVKQSKFEDGDEGIVKALKTEVLKRLTPAKAE